MRSDPKSNPKTEVGKNVKSVSNLSNFMPPTSKKLRGHIGLGLSVQSVSQSVSLSVSLSVCDA